MRHALLALSALVPLAPAQLTVSSVLPARNDVDAPTFPRIVVSFSEPIDPVSATAGSFQVFGRWSGVMTGTITLRNGDRELEFAPDRPFFPGEVTLQSFVQQDAGGIRLTNPEQIQITF